MGERLLGFGGLIAENIMDERRGKSTQFLLPDLPRQSICPRLSGYEDVNLAERLSQDPTFRLIGSEKIWERLFCFLSVLIVVLWFVPAHASAQTSSCEALKSKIDGQLQAHGVQSYEVLIVPAGTVTGGEIEGTCDGGKRNIVYLRHLTVQSGAKSSAAPRPPLAPPAPGDHQVHMSWCLDIRLGWFGQRSWREPCRVVHK